MSPNSLLQTAVNNNTLKHVWLCPMQRPSTRASRTGVRARRRRGVGAGLRAERRRGHRVRGADRRHRRQRRDRPERLGGGGHSAGRLGRCAATLSVLGFLAVLLLVLLLCGPLTNPSGVTPPAARIHCGIGATSHVRGTHNGGTAVLACGPSVYSIDCVPALVFPSGGKFSNSPLGTTAPGLGHASGHPP